MDNTEQENIYDLNSFRDDSSDVENDSSDDLYCLPSKSDIEKSEVLMPENIKEKEAYIWSRLGPYLVKESRLKAIFVDAFHEYCIVRVRLEEAREYLDENDWEYVVTGRNGAQHKSRPQVAQLNDDWRKWKSLVGEFGLGPNAEKTMANVGAVQTDLFNDL